jgi:molecular chaperone DnaK (HSP70)
MDIGIDLGTTFSVIAVKGRHDLAPDYPGGGGEYREECDVTIIPSLERSPIIPSVLWFDPAAPDQPVVGFQAKDKANEGEAPIMFSKRKIGTTEDLKLNGRTMKAREVATEFLRYMKSCAEQALGQPVRRAVITHPAYFDRNQVTETRQAAEAAGFDMSDERQMLMEPSAATLACLHADPKDPLIVLTYDLGGGTFDVTVIERRGGVPQMKAYDGDALLGGYNFDRELVQWIRNTVNKNPKHPKDSDEPMLRPDHPDYVPHDEANPEHRARQAKLLHKTEEVKIKLAEQRADGTKVQIKCVDELVTNAGKRVPFMASIDRTQYVALIKKDLERTIQCCHRALEKAKLTPDKVDYVLLVGGSTAGPWVRAAVEAAFPDKVRVSFSPDLCVAAGAAVQSADLPSIESRGGLQLTLDVPASSALEVLNVSGQVRGTAGARSTATRARLKTPAGSTDRTLEPMEPQSFLFENVALDPDGPTEMGLEILDGSGQVLITKAFTVTLQREGGMSTAIATVLPKPLFLRTADGLLRIAEEGAPLPAKCEAKVRRLGDESTLEIPVYQEGDEVGHVVIDNIPADAGVGALVHVFVEITQFNDMRGTAQVMRVSDGSVAAESPVHIQFPPIEVAAIAELAEQFELLKAEREAGIQDSPDPTHRVKLAGVGATMAAKIEKLFAYQPPDAQEIQRDLKELAALVHPTQDDLSPPLDHFEATLKKCRVLLAENKGDPSLAAFPKKVDDLEKKARDAAATKNRKQWAQHNAALEELRQQIRDAVKKDTPPPQRQLPPTPLLKAEAAMMLDDLRANLKDAETRYSGSAAFEGRIRPRCLAIAAEIDGLARTFANIDDDMESKQALAQIQRALPAIDNIKKKINEVGEVVRKA